MGSNVMDYTGSSMEDIAEDASPVPSFMPTSDLVTPQNIHSLAGSEATAIDGVISDVSSGYLLSAENQWGWITLYVITITIAVLGNLLFIIGSLCTTRSRNTGHYLLINLSVRDILLAGLCIPFTLDSEIINMTWNMGLEFCITFR